MPEQKNPQNNVSEADIRRLLAGLDKLEADMEGGFFKKKKSEIVETAPEENELSDKDKLVRRKEELKQLIDVLESEFRESTISKKTYNEAINKSKQELLKIQSKLKELSPSEIQLETDSGGRLLDLEKMKIDMQNQVNDLTLKFSKAEISSDEYNPKVEALKTQLEEIEGEIIRVGQGKSIDKNEPEKPTEPTKPGIITQAMEVVEEKKPEKEEEKPEKETERPEKEEEKSSESGGEKPLADKKKSKKKKFSIKSKLFGKKEEEKPEKEEEKPPSETETAPTEDKEGDSEDKEGDSNE